MTGKGPQPLRLVNFCRHKTAGWEGFIFLNVHGEAQVTNGICIWPLVPRRMDSLEIVETVDTQHILGYLASRPGNEPVAALLQGDLPGFRQDMEYPSDPLMDGVCYVMPDKYLKGET